MIHNLMSDLCQVQIEGLISDHVIIYSSVTEEHAPLPILSNLEVSDISHV